MDYGASVSLSFARICEGAFARRRVRLYDNLACGFGIGAMLNNRQEIACAT